MKNQAGLKLEIQALIYRFRWDSWAAATFGPPTRTLTTRTATILRFNLLDPNEIFPMAGKSPDRHWKTADQKISGQLKKLESEHADLLKTIDGHLADVKSQLAQKKTISAERTYQCFFEIYDELEENRHKQRLLLKPKYFEFFDSDTKRILEEKSKVLRWSVESALSPSHRNLQHWNRWLSERRTTSIQISGSSETNW